jgi:hypothetical protein
MKDIRTNINLKFWKENMIMNDIQTIQKLIQLLESRDFLLEFNIGERWFDDSISLLIKSCKEAIIIKTKKLVESEKYK